MGINLNERTKREKETYNQGVTLSIGYKFLTDSIKASPSRERRKNLLSTLMTACKNKVVLEIGSEAWKNWINFQDYPPKQLICINISESELDRGINKSKISCLRESIAFLIMDAHRLCFADSFFDVVYGGAILHHLDLEKAMEEIYRVLKPGGVIIFSEPLTYNPFAKLVRFFTPEARTPDEKPLGQRELHIISRFFLTRCYFFEFLSVPFSIISSWLFGGPQNAITRFADRVDIFLEKTPYLKYLYSGLVIYGIKK